MAYGFPFGILLLVLVAASLFFGADSPMTAYLFSAQLLLLGGVALILRRSDRIPLVVPVAVLLLIGFMLADVVYGRFSLAGPDYAVLAAALAVFVLAERAGRRAGDFGTLWRMMLGLFLVFSVWAFVDFALNPDTIHGTARPYHQDRLSAAFLSANTAATLFGVILLAAAAELLRATRRMTGLQPMLVLETLFRHATIGLATFLFAAVCLLLTASRAGLTFAMLSLLLLCGWEFLARRRTAARGSGFGPLRAGLVALGAVAVLGLFLWNMSGDVAGARYTELEEDADTRLVMFSAYWEAVQARPLTGYGLGSFSAVNNQIQTFENAHILSTQGAAHNFVLQWLMQTGLIGAAAMWGITAWILVRIYQGLSRRRRGLTYIRTILMISLFVVLHSLVDFAIEIPGFMWWWVLILGLGAGYAAGGGGKTPRLSD